MRPYSVQSARQTKEPDVIPDSIYQLVVRFAQPLLRRFDNPFFALEMQLMARCTRSKKDMSSLETGVIFAILIMAFPIFLPFYEKYFDKAVPPSQHGAEVVVGWVAFCHLFFCLWAVKWGAGRIFQREHNCGTLLDTFLFPIVPLRWIGLKIVLPLHLLAIAWLTALPIHGILLLTGDVRPSALFKALFLPLWFGLVALGYTLILTPDYLCNPPQPAPQDPAERSTWRGKPLERQAADRGHFALAYGFGFLSFWGWMRWIFGKANDFSALLELRDFYFMLAPIGLFWLVLNIGFFVGAAVRAGAMLSPSFEHRRQAAALSWSIVGTIYYTGLGYYWLDLDTLTAWGALFAPAIAAIIVSRITAQSFEVPAPNDYSQTKPAPAPTPYAQKSAGKEAEDDASEKAETAKDKKFFGLINRPKAAQRSTRSEREISWLAREYDNAVFLKDLRVHLRSTSLQTDILGHLAFGVILIWFMVNIGSGVARANAWLWIGFLQMLNRPSQKASTMWRQEARGVTLTLLLLSPLSSREIARGRLWAGLITGCAAAISGFIYLAAMAWAIFRGPVPSLFPALFAMLPLPLLSLCCDAAAAPGEDFENTKEPDNFWGGLAAFILGIPCFLLLIFGRELPLWVLWLISAGLFAFYVGIAFTIFDEGVKKLDKRRLLIDRRKKNYRQW